VKKGFSSRYRPTGTDGGCYEISKAGELCLRVEVRGGMVRAITAATGGAPSVEDLQELEAAGILSPRFMGEIGLARPVMPEGVDFWSSGG
jgi:hypothetical protein